MRPLPRLTWCCPVCRCALLPALMATHLAQEHHWAPAAIARRLGGSGR